MTRRSITHQQRPSPIDAQVQSVGRLRSRRQMIAVLLGPLSMLLVVASAHAGTYVINNCPSAGNGNAGSWTVFGSPQNVKGTCSGGAGDYIGPRGGSMSPGDLAGVQIGAPAGITIREAKIWWQVSHQVAGADTFAIAADNGGVVGESTTPLGAGNPDTFVLSSTTTEITLANYCSNDDAGAGCTFGGGENNILELYGAQLTLFDSGLPSGSVTGGSLAGSGPLSGTQALAYNASDGGSGVRYVELILDGQSVAKNDYIAECPYQNFAACPASVSGTISWNTGAIADGQHELALRIVNAGGNSSIVDDHTITTHNSPTVTTPPTITGTPIIGQTLTGIPGTVSSNPGAGSVKTAGQWQRCDSAANNCVAIPGATGTSYNLTVADEGHTLIYQETISNNAGSVVAQSAAFGPVTASAAEKERAEKERAEKERTEKERVEREKAATSGSNGANGSPGAGGSGGTAAVDVFSPGSNLGSVLLGSAAKWTISLHVSPTKVRRHSRIELTGSVSTSPRPTEGKLIFLQARSLDTRWKGSGHSRHRVSVFGKWVTFQEFRAKPNGSFSSAYTFRLGGNHTYQFQAIAPAEGQYRNPTGTSTAVSVREI